VLGVDGRAGDGPEDRGYAVDLVGDLDDDVLEGASWPAALKGERLCGRTDDLAREALPV
jgi:hypothetical protein